MTRFVLNMALLLSLLACSAPVAAAVPPGIVNAQVETRTAAQSIDREIAALGNRPSPVWIGYRSASVGGPSRMCSDRGWSTRRIMLERPTELTVLARIEHGQLVALQLATDDCEVDAGGLPLVWLDEVSAESSVAWLRSLVAVTSQTAHDRRIVDRALLVLVWHPDARALDAVISTARQDTRTRVRSQALFWLAQRAGQQAVATIAAAVDSDPDTEVKKKAVFALSQLPKDDGTPLLIRTARTHSNPAVRKQAMFWLGQSGDPRAVSFFEEVLRR